MLGVCKTARAAAIAVTAALVAVAAAPPLAAVAATTQPRVVTGSVVLFASSTGELHDDHAPAAVALDTGDELIPLNPATLPGGVEPGAQVAATLDAAPGGQAAPTEPLDVRSMHITAPPASRGLGRLKVLVVPARFPGEAAPRSVAATAAAMGELDRWLQAASRGRTSLDVEVAPHVTITNIGCGANAHVAHSDAVAAAGRSYGDYDHVVVTLPPSAGCSWAGYATMPGQHIFVAEPHLTLRTLTHELGHNFGLPHMDLLVCYDGTTPVAFPAPHTDRSACHLASFIDPSTVMGDPTPLAHFAPSEQERLGWLRPGEVTTVSEEEVTLHVTGSPTAGLRVAHVDLADGSRFTVEFAAAVSTGGVRHPAGAALRYRPSPGWVAGLFSSPQLIRVDANPASNRSRPKAAWPLDAADATFTPGTGFSDPQGRFSMQVLAATATSVTVRVADTGAAAASAFTPLTPARVLDTRPGQAVGHSGFVGRASTIDLQVSGRGGVPATGASAVVLNVTATHPSAGGYVTVWPAGAPRPLASSLNVTGSGQSRANQVTVPVGAGGRVSLYSSSGTHLVADVAGYYRPASQAAAGRFIPVPPSRVTDTRVGRTPPAPLDRPKGTLAAGSTAHVAVAGRHGVPASAAGVVLNVTATETASGGYVTVWPAGTARPLASSLNVTSRGETAPNLVTVPVGEQGRVAVYASMATHLLVDVVGYITPAGAPTSRDGLFVPLAPTRWFDSRQGVLGQGRLRAGIWTPAAAPGAVPAGASGVLFNLTATGFEAPGYVAVAAEGEGRPEFSNLNVAGVTDVLANATVTSMGRAHAAAFYPSSPGHLVADLAGFWL